MGALNDILAQMKQKDEQINAVSLDEIQKAQRAKDKANMQADIDVSNAGYNSQISNTQAVYDKQIGDTKTAYESEYQKNAVQKLINEKKIAEVNANLGLTDSGINRTQQTAAQLSYANQKGKIDLARQSALDELGLSLTNAITTLQNEKASAERDITNNWNSYSDSIAQNTYNTKIGALVDERNALAEQYADMYKTQIEADAAVEKERINAAAAIEEANKTKDKILWYNTGTYDNDKNPIFRNSEGKIQAFGVGTNPYTGYIHNDAKTNGKYDPSKVFSNGYQPNNIDGEKLRAAKNEEGGVAYTDITGKKQTIWKCGNRYYVWYGDENIYKEMDVSELNLK